MKKTLLFISLLIGLCACMEHKHAEPVIDISFPAAYVVNGSSNSLSVIDLTDNTVKHEIKLGDTSVSHDGHNTGSVDFSYPHHICINKAKTKLAIAVPNMDFSGGHSDGMMDMKGNIIIVNPRNCEILKVLELPKSNHNAIFSPDDSEIWTSQMEENGKILIYDAETYTLKNTIKVGAMPAEVTFSYDGKTAFVANTESDNVTAINVANKSVIKTIKVGVGPVAAWTGADNRNYVDNEASKEISIISNETLSVVSTIELVNSIPDYVAYLPTSQEIWITIGGESKILIYKLSSGVYKKISEIVTNSGAHAIAFTQDYKTAYVTNQGFNTVSVIDVAKKTKIKDIRVGSKPNGIVLN